MRQNNQVTEPFNGDSKGDKRKKNAIEEECSKIVCVAENS